ncbi:MAG: hydrogenase assembly protein HypC [Planctomycetales bacterium 4484_123]|nr:MAG: hydrogenase assembly protein HypC [Planctomycetales bacterium 4484_123]
MCLAVPAKIESIDGQKATVSLAGMRSDVVTSLTPEAKVGDYVLVHAGYAITVLSEQEARETFTILREMVQGSE